MSKYFYGLTEHNPDKRDFMLSMNSFKEIPIVKPIDLSFQVPFKWLQGNAGYCYAFGGSASYAADYFKLTGKPYDPSKLFLAVMARNMIGQLKNDSGCDGRTTLKAMVNFGIPPESEYPYNIDLGTVLPPQKVQDDALKYRVLKYYFIPACDHSAHIIDLALASGYGVMIGMRLHESFEGDSVRTSGVVPMPGNIFADPIIGGHMMYVDGCKDGYKQFMNWWGWDWGFTTSCGIGGHGWMPDAIINSKDFMFAAVVSSVEIGA